MSRQALGRHDSGPVLVVAILIDSSGSGSNSHLSTELGELFLPLKGQS